MKIKIRKSDDEEAVEANLATIEEVLNAPRISHARARLNHLLRFLSIDFDTDEAPTGDNEYLLKEIFRCARYEFAPRRRLGKRLELVRERPNWRRAAKAVQRELRQDLMTIVSASSADAFDAEQKYNSFASELFAKLQDVNRRSQQIIARPSKPLPAPIKTIKNRRRRYWEITSGFGSKDGGGILLGGQEYCFQWTPKDTLRDEMYFHLAGAIEERCLEDLKLCQQCKKLLHLRDKYCSDACRKAAIKKRRSEIKYMQNHRAKKREKDLTKAHRLRYKEKWPLLSVVEEPGLSQRILNKAGII